MLTYEHIKATFASLVAIDSPSLSERAMADHIKALFAGIGIALLEDKSGTVTGSTAGNLYAYVEGDKTLEPVLLAAHMDTVAPACKKQAGGWTLRRGLLPQKSTGYAASRRHHCQGTAAPDHQHPPEQLSGSVCLRPSGLLL